MINSEINRTVETKPKILPVLSETEDAWLSDFGFDLSKLSDIRVTNELNSLVVKGSQRIKNSGQDPLSSEIVGARVDFLNRIGMNSSSIARVKKSNTTLTPLNNFIDTLRVINSFGIDTGSVVNGHPETIGYGSKSVKEKIRLIDGYSRVLKWGGNSHELIESTPNILGIKVERLQVMGHIAANYATSNSRRYETKDIPGLLSIPLATYIIAADELNRINNLDLKELVHKLQYQRLTKSEREAQAQEIATSGNLDSVIASKYLHYAGIKDPSTHV